MTISAAARRSRRRRDAAAASRTWNDPHLAPLFDDGAAWGVTSGESSPELGDARGFEIVEPGLPAEVWDAAS